MRAFCTAPRLHCWWELPAGSLDQEPRAVSEHAAAVPLAAVQAACCSSARDCLVTSEQDCRPSLQCRGLWGHH